jgi:hypothetical protein
MTFEPFRQDRFIGYLPHVSQENRPRPTPPRRGFPRPTFATSASHKGGGTKASTGQKLLRFSAGLPAHHKSPPTS